MSDARTPAEVWPLAHFITEELKERGWTTRDVAKRYTGDLYKGWILFGLDLALMVPPSEAVIHEEVIRAYAEAFNVSPEFLRSIEKGWHDHPDRRGKYRVDMTVVSTRPNW